MAPRRLRSVASGLLLLLAAVVIGSVAAVVLVVAALAMGEANVVPALFLALGGLAIAFVLVRRGLERLRDR